MGGSILYSETLISLISWNEKQKQQQFSLVPRVHREKAERQTPLPKSWIIEPSICVRLKLYRILFTRVNLQSHATCDYRHFYMS